jgi:hypothetical protein
MNSTKNLYFAPVERVGETYQQRSVSQYPRSFLVPYQDLSSYIQRHHVETIETVFLNGVGYRAYVYVAQENTNDISYILVNGDLVPQGPDGDRIGDQADSESTEHDLNRAYQALDNCRSTESPFPTEQDDLLDAFIFPNLVQVKVLEKGRVRRKSEAASVDDLLAEHRAVILGVPGSGKTTLMRYLALRFADDFLDEHPTSASVPIYIQLRLADFAREDPLRGHLAVSQKGRHTWLLDGFDEISPSRAQLAREAILDLIQTSPTDRVFLCSRALAYDGFLHEKAAHYEIEPFTYRQTAQWIYRRLSFSPESYWRGLIYNLRTVPEIQSLSSNPLLLSVLVHQHEFERVRPQQRGELLGRFVDILCRDWDSARGFSRGTDESVPPHRRATVLAWMAYEAKMTQPTCVSPAWLQSLPGSETLIGDLDAEAVLHELAEHTGLLMPGPGHEQWNFSHPLLQDFLAAKHLVARTGDIVDFLQRNVSIQEWCDVWLLACSVATDPSQLVASVVVSDVVDDDIKSLLFVGAWAQGVRLEGDLADRCRNVLLNTFNHHASRLGNVVRDKETALICSEKQDVGGQDVDFIQRLLALLYRVRWWTDGTLAIQALGQGGGDLGRLVAEVFKIDGWPTINVSHREEELVFQITTNVEEEGDLKEDDGG